MEPIAVGQIAPEMTLEDALEQQVHIADYKGKKYCCLGTRQLGPASAVIRCAQLR